jgi:hypothetical protein
VFAVPKGKEAVFNNLAVDVAVLQIDYWKMHLPPSHLKINRRSNDLPSFHKFFMNISNSSLIYL